MRVRWTARYHLAHCKSCRPPQKRIFSTSSRRDGQSSQNVSSTDVSPTRNIGIIAHIDAGKTTTTERMLYYSGFTRRIGDVDEGSTVTDFLPAERARGITIQSAAVSFSWPPVGAGGAPSSSTAPLTQPTISHNINLIDTPGHADFTFEVLRSLRVLDGAVCILDGVAGVEAQTEKVWSQASAYAIPRIVFVNKLDRDGAAFARTVREVGAKLDVWPVMCNIPWWTRDGRLQGVGDAVAVRALRYSDGGDGKQIDMFNLHQLESEDRDFADELVRARIALVESLSEHDDVLVEKYLEVNDQMAIPAADIIDALRRCVLKHPQRVAPVYAGASFRNTGVQPLMDAVVSLLPTPEERPDPEISLGSTTKSELGILLSGKLDLEALAAKKVSAKVAKKERHSLALRNLEGCALAFKVVTDAKRGVLVYVRVYSGVINRNTSLWNTNLQNVERTQRLLKMYANEAVDIDSIPAGQIGVIPGLKFARTGDTLLSYTGLNPKTGPPQPLDRLQLRPIDIPPPVFFVSVEANSLSEEKHIKESLDLLLREDPSLHVSIDEESGQTHLSGMGELHLEIARDRLVNDLKAKARIGKIEIGYREAVTNSSREITEVFDRETAGKSAKVACTASIGPLRKDSSVSLDGQTHAIDLGNDNRLTVYTPTMRVDGEPIAPDQSGLPEDIPIQTVLQSLHTGCLAALARGPAHGYPIQAAQVFITFDHTKHLFPNSTPAALSSAARRAVQQALAETNSTADTILMEPVMLVTINVNDDSLGAVVHDISSARGGTVVSLGGSNDDSSEQGVSIDVTRIYTPPDPFGGNSDGLDGAAMSRGIVMRQITARVPLKEMVGYLKHLRSLTAGRGTFTMVVDRFEKMAAQRQRAVLNAFRGDM